MGFFGGRFLLFFVVGGVMVGRCLAEARPVLSCAAEPAEVAAGQAVTLTARGLDLPGGKRFSFQWTGPGGVVAGDGSSVSVDTKGLASGSYDAGARLVDTKKGRVVASCSTNFVVGRGAGEGTETASVVDVGPLKVGCAVSRAAVTAGDTVTVTTTATGQKLTYSYSATHGVVTGDGPSALLSTAGVAGGDITVACMVTDGAGRTASGRASLVVAGPVVLPAPSGKTEPWRGMVDSPGPARKVIHSRRVRRGWTGWSRRRRRRTAWCPCVANRG